MSLEDRVIEMITPITQFLEKKALDLNIRVDERVFSFCFSYFPSISPMENYDSVRH